ncbi:glycoside hydrolase superfamily [Kockovaella imperatae]|uniref:Beta-mannosidase A n=1 Tax=Kockovaella imperatae TaxID=4999 RepID=A0A1Y1UKQ2_9TREE|nr:glycoside hydrolase superfamily [Kockovaella imperatae]ORX38084.1 glycoside hydrolase superfamily [Kockovaella imperatae]
MSSFFSRLMLAMSCSRGNNIISLNGNEWTLTSPGNDSFKSIPAKVPSQNYVDLQAAGVTQDILYGYQEDEQVWVQNSNWSYNHAGVTLDTSPGLSTHLVFEGLDTFTTISFCNEEVATTNDQYQQYIIDVTNIVSSCKASPIPLSINFGPAVNISVDMGLQGDPNIKWADGCQGSQPSCREFIRKEQSDMGWDWAPHIVPAGPWREISVVQLNSSAVYVNNVAIDIYRQGQMNNLPPDQNQNWIFNASLDYVGSLPSGSGLSLSLTDANGNSVLSTSLSDATIGASNGSGTITASTTIDASQVQLWWPNGMGAQTLYQASIAITSPGGSNARRHEKHRRSSDSIATVERTVGFRTIVWNGQPISAADQALGIAPGSNWHFEINGEIMYAKGANLVPLNAVWATQLFELAVQANFNMMRVWSSGAYLADYIYSIADKAGILLWSEFEFSDGAYQATGEFPALYEAEAYYNIRRVNYHPSLALWAGGNELEADELAYWFNPNSPSPQMAAYQAIQEELLIKCVYANSRSISYIPSSLYNGYLSLDFDSVRPQVPRYKNTSGPEYLYNDAEGYVLFTNQCFNISFYPSSRFVDEFGWNSFPTTEVFDNIGQGIDSCYDPVVIYHNRHEGGFFGQVLTPEQESLAGINQMLSGQVMYYPVPTLSDPAANFTAWIYGSQVFQADHLATQISVYRRGSGQSQRNLGSLYWMFNDVWVAPTWSAVTSNLKSKVMVYTSRDIYSPVIVRPYYDVDVGDLQVWVTSDQFFPVSGNVKIEWMTWSGEPQRQPVSSEVLPRLLPQHCIYPSRAFRHSRSQSQLSISTTVTGNGQTFTHQSWYHPVYLNNATLMDPKLTISCDSGSNSFTVTAPAAVAAWVVLDYSSHEVSGYWSDNGFWLGQGESRTVQFTVWNDWTGDSSWQQGVTVRSMYDNVISREYAATVGA